MVMGSANCPSEVHFITVFALRNGKFSSRMGLLTPIPLLSFVPGYGDRKGTRGCSLHLGLEIQVIVQAHALS